MPTRPAAPPELPWSDAEIQRRIQRAVLEQWTGRDAALEDQRARGVRDAGTRGAVTAGKHLHAFHELLHEVAEVAQCADHRGTTVLPGYYRASKNWDWLAMRGDHLVAAVEFKSMVGSVGKNSNNRIEEVLGVSRDFWKAYHAGLFSRARGANGAPGPRPFLGYLYLLGEDDDIDVPRGVPTSRFPADAAFTRSSYRARFATLATRMMAEQDYTAVCFLVSRNDGRGTITKGDDAHSFATFIRALYRYLRG